MAYTVEVETVKEDARGLLVSLKQAYMTKNPEMYDIACKIVKQSGDRIDNDTYLWVMYVYMCYFKEQNMGIKYPYVRMRQVLDATNHKYPRSKNMDYKDITLAKDMIDDIYANSSFMDESLKSIQKTYTYMAIFIAIIAIVVMTIGFQLDIILSLGITVCLFVVNYFISFKNMKTNFIKNQTYILYDGCKDSNLKQFDSSIINS